MDAGEVLGFAHRVVEVVATAHTLLLLVNLDRRSRGCEPDPVSGEEKAD